VAGPGVQCGRNARNHPAWLLAGVAVDGAGTLYIADTDHNRVLKLTASGSVATVAFDSTGDRGSAVAATLKNVAQTISRRLHHPCRNSWKVAPPAPQAETCAAPAASFMAK